uniref:Uncharacterized protein n=1 Tax=Romanomermis culicivorax TaxID=13658 RepID=A0A915IF28_ROMCU
MATRSEAVMDGSMEALLYELPFFKRRLSFVRLTSTVRPSGTGRQVESSFYPMIIKTAQVNARGAPPNSLFPDDKEAGIKAGIEVDSTSIDKVGLIDDKNYYFLTVFQTFLEALRLCVLSSSNAKPVICRENRFGIKRRKLAVKKLTRLGTNESLTVS